MTGAQPSSMEPYLQPENPVTRNPLEEKATKHLEHHQHQHPGPSAKEAKPASQPQQHAGAAGGIPSALGRGVRGVDAQEAEVTAAAAGVGGHRDELQNENVNADEALATLAEGDVADAYQRKSGTQKVPGSGPAEEQDFASDLDRKKAEQAAAREDIKEARRSGTNVDGGAAGGRLGDETLNDA